MTKLTPVPNSPFSTKASGSWPYSVAFSPDGKYLATANNGGNSVPGTVSLFSVQSTGALTVIGAPVATGAFVPTSAAFSPDSSLLVAANYDGSHTVSIFNVKSTGPSLLGPPFAVGPTNKYPYSVAFRPVSTLGGPSAVLAAANFASDNTLSTFALAKSGAGWSVGAPKSFQTGVPSNPGYGPQQVAFHPNGNFAATANAADGSISLFFVKAANLSFVPPLISTLSAGSVVNTLAFSPKGDHLVSGAGLQPTVLLFKVTVSPPYLTQSGMPVSTGVPWGTNQVSAVAFSPTNNDLLAAASTDSVSLLAVGPGGLALQAGSPFPIPGYPYPNSVAFHPSGKWLAVGSGNWTTGAFVSMLAVG